MTAQTRPDELIRILRAEFVTKSGGVPGSLCVTFVCGATGWRATGGTIARTLVHEVAFQLTAAGNARGTDAVDLQINQFNATYVAAAPTSAILTNEQNKIEADCDYSVIAGPWNEIAAASEHNYVFGFYNLVDIGSYGNWVHGGNNELDDAIYNVVLGLAHDIDGASGCLAFGDMNDIIQNVNDYPTYCVSGGYNNIIEGDCWAVFQFGEENKAYGLGTPGETVWQSAQFGIENYQAHVACNFQFGQGTKSYLPAGADYYDGRILLSGDYPNDAPSDGTGWVGGFNQDSWFSQSDVITTWNVAWTTERFEFPIIQDSIWTFLIYVSATERGCANSHSFKIEGCIENDGGVTTMLASTTTNIYRDVATKECQAIADNANDRLAIQFRDTGGPDATWTNIQIAMFTVEVGAEV